MTRGVYTRTWEPDDYPYVVRVANPGRSKSPERTSLVPISREWNRIESCIEDRDPSVSHFGTKLMTEMNDRSRQLRVME